MLADDRVVEKLDADAVTGLSPDREAAIRAGQHPREAVILNALYCEADSEAAERAEQALSEIIQELAEVRQERDEAEEEAAGAINDDDRLWKDYKAALARLDAMTEALREMREGIHAEAHRRLAAVASPEHIGRESNPLLGAGQ